MSTYEKLGGYLLFEKLSEDKFSKDFLAGQISGSQIQQICILKRFDPSLAVLPDFIQNIGIGLGVKLVKVEYHIDPNFSDTEFTHKNAFTIGFSLSL